MVREILSQTKKNSFIFQHEIFRAFPTKFCFGDSETSSTCVKAHNIHRQGHGDKCQTYFCFFKPSLLRIVQFCPFQAIYMLFLYLKVNIIKYITLTFWLKISPDPTNQDFYLKIQLLKMNTKMEKISIV